MDKLVSGGRKNIGRVVDKIIQRHYPEVAKSKKLSFEDLITWHTWQTFLKIRGRLIVIVLKKGYIFIHIVYGANIAW